MILYSNGCPKCVILKDKLDENNIEYTISNDYSKLMKRRIMSAPVLELEDGNMLLFEEAMEYVEEMRGANV